MTPPALLTLATVWLALWTVAADDTPATPPPTTPPTPTPSPWIDLGPGCTAALATKFAATANYQSCQKASTFTFERAGAVAFPEDAFCSQPSCLKLYRALKNESEGAVMCAKVPGLANARLDTADGPTKCFGADAASGKSDVIKRPGKSSGSGSGDAGTRTTAPPTKTPEPSTTAPPTQTPEPTTANPDGTKTPKPTKKPKPGTEGSGSGEALAGVTRAPSGGANGTQDGDDSGSGLDTGTIVAIVGVSIGVVAVGIALVYVTTRKRKRKTKSRTNRSTYSGGETVSHEQLQSYYGDPTRPSGSHAGRPSGVAGRGSLAGRPSGHAITGGPSTAGLGGRSSTPWHSGTAGFGAAFEGWDEELIAAVRIPYEKLTFDELMSRGGYGEVYRGTYRGELVAIKTLLPERRRDMQQIQSFLAEVKMMANMEHERIVRFIGVAWDSLEELSVVSEFLERGDLRTVLSGFEKNKTCAHGFDANKVKIALHVAHGLTYMHTLQPIVLHRDLKSRNILLDAELNAKITDFGVSRERSDRTMTAGVGSSLWMAPEVMMGERYDEKADIFSFGVVLSELDNHVLPYSHAIERATGRRMPDAVILQMVSQGRMRVAFTDETKSEMARIGLKCVALSPKDRPTSAELLHLIHQVWRRY